MRGGSVKLTRPARFPPGGPSVRARSVGARHLIPDAEGARSQETVVDNAEQMSAQSKEVLYGSVHREKPLRVGSRFEPAHLTLPLPGRLVRDFGPIVRVMVRAVDHGRHHGAAGRGVTVQFVGDQLSRDTALSFQQLAEKAESPRGDSAGAGRTPRPDARCHPGGRAETAGAGRIRARTSRTTAGSSRR